jgi:hypothetical protein
LRQIALEIFHNSQSELRQIALEIFHNSRSELRETFYKK